MSEQVPTELQHSPSNISVRRDRVGRIIARAIGISGLVVGVVTAPSAHTVIKAVGILIVTGSFCSWMFYMARRAPGPAADDSG